MQQAGVYHAGARKTFYWITGIVQEREVAHRAAHGTPSCPVRQCQCKLLAVEALVVAEEFRGKLRLEPGNGQNFWTGRTGGRRRPGRGEATSSGHRRMGNGETAVAGKEAAGQLRSLSARRPFGRRPFR